MSKCEYNLSSSKFLSDDVSQNNLQLVLDQTKCTSLLTTAYCLFRVLADSQYEEEVHHLLYEISDLYIEAMGWTSNSSLS